MAGLSSNRLNRPLVDFSPERERPGTSRGGRKLFPPPPQSGSTLKLMQQCGHCQHLKCASDRCATAATPLETCTMCLCAYTQPIPQYLCSIKTLCLNRTQRRPRRLQQGTIVRVSKDCDRPRVMGRGTFHTNMKAFGTRCSLIFMVMPQSSAGVSV